MNNSFKEITVIIILYEESLNLVLKSLQTLKNFKIIIVDNSNNKFLKMQIENQYKIYKYILNKKNYGYSKAANQAIKLSDTEYILMFQADGIISQKDIFKLLETHKKYNNSFIVTPTLFDKDGNLDVNCSSFPEKNQKKTPVVLDGDICSETVLGSILMFKKKDILDIGLYDENFFLYFLDDELCRRARDKKKSVIQTLDAKATHSHGQIKAKNLLKRTYLRNFNFTFDELYYFYKIKKHNDLFNKLKNKIPKYFLKLILSLLILRLNKAIYFFSKILAYYKFKKFF